MQHLPCPRNDVEQYQKHLQKLPMRWSSFLVIWCDILATSHMTNGRAINEIAMHIHTHRCNGLKADQSDGLSSRARTATVDVSSQNGYVKSMT